MNSAARRRPAPRSMNTGTAASVRSIWMSIGGFASFLVRSGTSSVCENGFLPGARATISSVPASTS